MATPASRYTASARAYRGLDELDYPCHDWTAVVTRAAASAISGARSISVRCLPASRSASSQIDEHIWLVSFMDYDLGYFDDETCRLEPIDNPFGPKLLPMSPE